MRASDVMTRRVVCVHPATTVEDAAKLMIRHRVSGLPVVDGDERLVGIVTESDLLYRPESGTDRRDRNWLNPGHRARLRRPGLRRRADARGR